MLEGWIGARLTTSLTRVGGMGADIPDGCARAAQRRSSTTSRRSLDEIDRVLTRNGIWVGRTVGLGVMSPEEAVNYGLSGPMVRASGVAFDVRKDFPYLDYETYDFDVPGRHERRRLRPLPRPHGGAAAVARAFSSRRSSVCPTDR